MLDGVGEEIRVDEDGIWGHKGGVVLEEEGGLNINVNFERENWLQWNLTLT